MIHTGINKELFIMIKLIEWGKNLRLEGERENQRSNRYTRLHLIGLDIYTRANKMQTGKTKIITRSEHAKKTPTSTFFLIHFAVHPLATLCIRLYREEERMPLFIVPLISFQLKKRANKTKKRRWWW